MDCDGNQTNDNVPNNCHLNQTVAELRTDVPGQAEVKATARMTAYHLNLQVLASSPLTGRALRSRERGRKMPRPTGSGSSQFDVVLTRTTVARGFFFNRSAAMAAEVSLKLLIDVVVGNGL